MSLLVLTNQFFLCSVESECTAPGDKPVNIGVKEQRLTGLLTYLFIGLSAFMSPMLRFIPMPVLYGVFLYMGISSLRGVQVRILVWARVRSSGTDSCLGRVVTPKFYVEFRYGFLFG